MQIRFLTISILLVAAGSAQAKTLNINNWCGQDVTVSQSVGGGADQHLFNIPASHGRGAVKTVEYTDNVGTSVKIGKVGVQGILQFEYTNAPGTFWWDLSDLDGKGAGLVGTPFFHDNVKASPTGNGEGKNTCVKIRCPAGEICRDAYQHPDDTDTKSCPSNTGNMWLDLCEPDAAFHSKRSHNDKNLRRHAISLQEA